MAELGAGGVSTFPGATPGAPYPQYFGIYFGVVHNNADPLSQNRCLLQVPQLFGTAVTTWATSLTPLQNAPAVGTVITAMFIGGDVDYPVYLVTDPAMLALETNSANIQPVGTANSAGSSENAAAANHVHALPLSAVTPLLDTNAGDIQPVTATSTAGAGSTGKPVDAGHTHAASGFMVPGSGGFFQILSSAVTGGDTQASITLESADYTGSGALVTINAGQVNMPATVYANTSTINIANGFINLNMASPTGYPLSTDPNTGSSWATGERNYINALVNCVNSIVQSMINRQLFA